MIYNPIEIYSKIMCNIMPYVYNICSSHDITHMQTVFYHAIEAVKEIDVDDNIKSAIVIAAFLHDIDDKKFYNTIDFNNARNMIRAIKCDQEEELIIKMIKYVSSSTNKNEITEECITNPWLLIPRYCDRLEAIGIIGLERTYRYTKTIKRQLYNENTIKYKTIKELYCQEIIDRHKTYDGNSVTMIDHMYDKLLHIYTINTGNIYINKMMQQRNNVLVEFCLDFGKNKFKSEQDMENYILIMIK